MYHLRLQEESQSAQHSQKEDCLKRVKVKVYAGKHQHQHLENTSSAHTSQSPTKHKKKKTMSIRRVVSHAIRPAPIPLEASRSYHCCRC
jgi:hypothetical protein